MQTKPASQLSCGGPLLSERIFFASTGRDGLGLHLWIAFDSSASNSPANPITPKSPCLLGVLVLIGVGAFLLGVTSNVSVNIAGICSCVGACAGAGVAAGASWNMSGISYLAARAAVAGTSAVSGSTASAVGVVGCSLVDAAPACTSSGRLEPKTAASDCVLTGEGLATLMASSKLCLCPCTLAGPLVRARFGCGAGVAGASGVFAASSNAGVGVGAGAGVAPPNPDSTWVRAPSNRPTFCLSPSPSKLYRYATRSGCILT